MIGYCGNCNQMINRKPSRFKRSKNLYCSMKCRNKHYRITKKGEINLGKFIKGHISWNNGIKGIHLSPKSEFKEGQVAEEKNFFWKGDEAGYTAIHQWLGRKLGKPNKCSNCGTIKAKRFEWANISRKYKRTTDDYMRLCKKCHNLFDDIVNKSKETRRLHASG